MYSDEGLNRVIRTLGLVGCLISFFFVAGNLLDGNWSENDWWVAIYLISSLLIFYVGSKEREERELKEKFKAISNISKK